MAKPTHDEIIRELSREVAILKEHRLVVINEMQRLRELETRVALVEQRVDDMRLGWDRWLTRAWMILAPVVAAIAAYYLGLRK